MSASESAKSATAKIKVRKLHKLLSAHAFTAAALFNKQQQLHDNSTSSELRRNCRNYFPQFRELQGVVLGERDQATDLRRVQSKSQRRQVTHGTSAIGAALSFNHEFCVVSEPASRLAGVCSKASERGAGCGIR
jgi:hypothetical protein